MSAEILKSVYDIYVNMIEKGVWEDTITWPLHDKKITNNQDEILKKLAFLYPPEIFISDKQIDIYMKNLEEAINIYIHHQDIILQLLSNKNNNNSDSKDILIFLGYLPIDVFEYALYQISYTGRNILKYLLLKQIVYEKHIKIEYHGNNILNYFNSIPKYIRAKKRIGYITTFFKYHSVMRDRFGIIARSCIDYDRYVIVHDTAIDPKYEEFFKDNGINIIKTSINIPQKIEQIRSLNLDCLVFCDIGMSIENSIVASFRLAPVQITTWGHSNTSGFKDSIDYYVLSKKFITDDMQNSFSEKLYPVNSISTYYLPPLVSDIKDLPDELFQHIKGRKICWCLQNPNKFHPVFDRIFRDIIDQTDAYIMISKFKFSDETMNKLMKRITLEQRKYRDRFIILDYISDPQIYSRLLMASICVLDTYPFGGCNTTMDALYHNIPIITLPSQILSGRFSKAFINEMGSDRLNDLLVANSFDDYISLVKNLINNSSLVKECSEIISERKSILFGNEKSIITWNDMIDDITSF